MGVKSLRYSLKTLLLILKITHPRTYLKNFVINLWNACQAFSQERKTIIKKLFLSSYELEMFLVPPHSAEWHSGKRQAAYSSLRLMTHSIKKLRITGLSKTTLRLMTLSLMSHSIKTLSLISLSIKTLSIMALSFMTLCLITLSTMAIRKITQHKDTENNDTYHKDTVRNDNQHKTLI
jgi:hypothetical protein